MRAELRTIQVRFCAAPVVSRSPYPDTLLFAFRRERLHSGLWTSRPLSFAALADRFGRPKLLAADTLRPWSSSSPSFAPAKRMALANPNPPDKPKRAPLPASLLRTEIRHEPETTSYSCGCQTKRIGENVAEKLDYVPVSSRWRATSGASARARPAGEVMQAVALSGTISTGPDHSTDRVAESTSYWVPGHLQH